jgi:hypothetical protein
MPRSSYQSPYKALKLATKSNAASEATTQLLIDLVNRSLNDLEGYGRETLIPVNVPGKEYFAFQRGNKMSRPVSGGLFDLELCKEHLHDFASGTYQRMARRSLEKFLYTLAMSFCCANDMRTSGDKKTPATFFECFVANIFSRELGVLPTRKAEVLNLDMQATLPTDYLFNLGPNKAKIHLPVKISTRERVVQVWAHQRVLDGVYGVGRFQGILVVITETNLVKGGKVTEVCLPDQWKVYQMFISQLKRVYYLDLPIKYAKLSETYPFLQVKSFAEFFDEKDRLISAGLE